MNIALFIRSHFRPLGHLNLLITFYIVFEVLTSKSILPRCSNKSVEHRVCCKRLRFVFRMKLACDEERMVLTRQFNQLVELSVGCAAAEAHAPPLTHVSDLRVEFAPVPVPLAALFGSVVDLPPDRAVFQLTIPRPQSHRSAQLVHIHQVAKL